MSAGLGITADMAQAALGKLRERHGSTDLMQQYRDAHREAGCRVVTYTPDQDGMLPLLADARCPICKQFDTQGSAE